MTSALLKFQALWDVTPCWMVKYIPPYSLVIRTEGKGNKTLRNVVNIYQSRMYNIKKEGMKFILYRTGAPYAVR
jgi:hypothetical protein